MQVKIADQLLGSEYPPFIVAEVGINHNGDLSKAFQMIEVAKSSGADAVKFQTFKAAEFCGDSTQIFQYQSQGKQVTEPILEMFQRYELSRDDWFKIKRHCDEVKIQFLSTPQNRSDLNILLELGVSAIKVGSDDFTNLPLLKDYSSTGLPLILSSGMSDLSECYQALDTVGAFDGYPVILLLCTSQYPTPPHDVNLLKLPTLAKAFPTTVLGFSDHTQGPIASTLAVSLGACFFEKHFTLNHNLPGPDHWFSEDPEGLKIWIQSIRTGYQMLGSPIVRPTLTERKNRLEFRRSVVALSSIQEGTILNQENVGLRRPGSGLPPSMIDKILGTTSTRTIKKGEVLDLGDFR